MDHYTRLRVIGKGSYGEVWLVKHKRDRKQYVLKKMEISNASRRERKAAEQEAKLLAKLKHPNICSYKDSFQTSDGLLYIAMGYCEGGDLYNRLKEQKGVALEERQVVEWFVQIAMALQYMHERNILHRDLKTQNIFLTKSKIIKVGDLGIARVLDNSNDMATTLIGTPYYMSPELFSNKPYNHKSDVWALGCCVYEMATLKHAFNARDMNSLVYKILRGRMPLMPKQYSPDLVTLIRAMLNSNPEKRPSVNRILRDPYIKKNISIFLESTRKHTSNKSSNNRRPSADIERGGERRGSDISSVCGDEVPNSARSSASNVSSVNKHPHPSSARHLPPTGRDSPSKQALKKKRQRAKREADQKGRGPSSQNGEVSDRDNRQQNNKPSKYNKVFNNAKPVENPRPLPPRPTPGREPASSVVVPRQSQSQHTAISLKEDSGYGSISSSVNSSKDDPRCEDDTPRQCVNLSARARRRERKESATPRTARSLDVDHHRQDEKPHLQSVGVAKSADYYLSAGQRIDDDLGQEPSRAPPSSASTPDKVSGGGRKLSQQPSLTEESSSDSDTVEAAENSNKSEKDRKKCVHVEICERTPPLPIPLTGEDEVDGGPRHAWPDNTNEVDEEAAEEEEVSKEKEMSNFISVLNSTLQMKSSASSKGDEEAVDEDEGVDDVDEVDGPVGIAKPVEEPYYQEVVISNFDYEPIRRPDLSRSHAPVKTLGTSTRLMDRITVLRKDCIRRLGVEKLKQSYDILDKVDGDQLEEELVQVLGRTDFDIYAGKIWQLKFCEEAAFGII